MNNNYLEKELLRINKKEEIYLLKKSEKKPSKIEELVEDKVPEKLQYTLKSAISKSFDLIFTKGINIIEKSYNKEEIILKHKVNSFAFDLKNDKKRTKVFNKEAKKSQNKNIIISSVKGVGLGLLGIGLPDIPLFMGVMLKGIYEIALQYGYDYETEEEKMFILNIINTSLLHGEEFARNNKILNEFIKDEELIFESTLKEEINKVSDSLTTELLYMKFLQGLAIVGVVGGVMDGVITKKVLEFAQMKYYRRFLTDKIKNVKA